jgi:hypothetical protein
MAMATYLDTVNNVLKRLREPTVTSTEETLYSTMVGVFVNDAKREIEDAHDWNVLSSTITINTQADVFGYSLEDSGTRFRTIDVLNNTSDSELRYAPTSWMNKQFLLSSTLQKAEPVYYNYNGVDSKGDTRVDLWPIPDNVYAVHFNLITPQIDLVDDDTKILVPSHLVAMLAYAKAIAERGEDNGNLSSEAYALYKSALSNEIAIDRNRYEEEVNWVAP